MPSGRPPRRRDYDAVVVGAGPNGLAAAIEMARAGRATLLLEAEEDIGGAARSAELTLPGFVHDVGAAITPLAFASPFMRSLPLQELGVEWVHPPVAAAHPLDNGEAALLESSVSKTAAGMGADAQRYLRLMQPLVDDWEKLLGTVLAPPRLPRHPLTLARFAALGLWPSTFMIRKLLGTESARGLMAGLAAHSVLPLTEAGTSAFALLFGASGHTTGWPFPRGGLKSLTSAMARYFESLGGEIETGFRVASLGELPPATSTLLDLSPGQIVGIAGDVLPSSYRRKLLCFQRAAGVFKVDYALSGPIPWKAGGVGLAGTVHLGGTLAEVAAAEKGVAHGRHPEHPFVLLAQQSLFDSSRAPAGHHTAWAYCHVPNGSTVDMADRIECQIERFAPGFRDVILARHVLTPADLERFDANLIGGDITGGAQNLWQLMARPVMSLNPYRTPAPGLFICSSSTPPGGGVHGMCGFWAAQAALRQERRSS